MQHPFLFREPQTLQLIFHSPIFHIIQVCYKFLKKFHEKSEKTLIWSAIPKKKAVRYWTTQDDIKSRREAKGPRRSVRVEHFTLFPKNRPNSPITATFLLLLMRAMIMLQEGPEFLRNHGFLNHRPLLTDAVSRLLRPMP